MPDEVRRVSKHKLVIEHRENVAITGVLDVISFDEEEVVCDTDMGILILRGTNLHVNSLNLDNGTLDIYGEVISATYEDKGQAKSKASFFGKVFK